MPVACTVASQPLVISLPPPGVTVQYVVPEQLGAGVIAAMMRRLLLFVAFATDF